MPDPLIEFLKRSAPVTSSKAVEHLQKVSNLSAMAARKRVQRAKSPVHQLPLIRLARNERILAIEGQTGSEHFHRALAQVLDAERSVYAHPFHSLQARGGACPISLMHTFSGAPLRRKGQLASEVVLKNLEALGFLGREEVPGLGSSFVLRKESGFTPAALRARMVAETILLGGLRDWLRKLGFVSYEKAVVRNDATPPNFGNVQWDVVGPSYIRPLATGDSTGVKPGFVVADVLLGTVISDAALSYFLRKTALLRYGGRTRPFLAVLVADEFAPDAWRRGRSEGVVVTTPKLLFGEAVAAALAELTRVLTNAAAAAINDPEAISRLFEQLSKIEGAAANLRGPLFEMIVGHCLHAREGRSIDIGKRVTTPAGERAELDVLGMLKNSAKAIECKGREPGHVERLRPVKEWLEVKVPRIVAWLRHREDYASVPCEFEYWTTGEFEPNAIEYLRQQQQRVKKYTINWKGGKDVVQYARTMNESRIVETLQEQFFRHPLATEQRRSTSAARPAAASIAPQPNASAPAAVINEAPEPERHPARVAAETSRGTDH